jgi:hypothetical protein
MRVFEDETWTMVPILPAGTAVSSAVAGGRPMQLFSTPGGLMWATNQAATMDVELRYTIAANAFEDGYILALPLPQSASTQLTATLPGTGLGVAVIPSTSSSTNEVGGTTRVRASIPSSSGAQISWRQARGEALTISRAHYRGELENEAVTWMAEFGVQLDSDERADLTLLSSQVALLGIEVDGVDATISVVDGQFSVSVQGRGEHVVTARFQVPVGGTPGQPRVSVAVPPVPVSRFELTLDGDKEVAVQPTASVSHQIADSRTTAIVNVPMTDMVSFAWSEAVPDDPTLEVEVVANASIYHAVHADEGVLYVHAVTIFEVTRGETSQFELAIPNDVQINRIDSPSGVVADWRMTEDGRATVFLDRMVSGELRFDVHYERLIPSTAEAPEIAVPLLTAAAVSRQRGMVALLASRELTLDPVRETSVTRVGENQLPAFIREAVNLTIAHTFRYFEGSPELVVQPKTPERVQGRFDARVDTLFSVGDVTTTAAATVDVNVKSGSIMDLELVLPAGVNFLSLSAPSLRDDAIETRDDRQVISVEFTQEMEGQFRIEVNYERINADSDTEVPVALIHVEGAEVEQGRIGIEALSAVEVGASTTEHLSSIEIGELPQQLILRTTNPILLAFKYVQAAPPPVLALRVTHHAEIEVQSATIDRAHYRTLYTTDGFTVTTAHFIVRNSRQQFLRVSLPPGAEVWSATVNGISETPAMANGVSANGRGPEVLINIINSAQGFPVELIYATRRPRLGFYGAVEAELPRPDMVVTETRWDLFLPANFTYGTPDGDLEVIEAGVLVTPSEMQLQTDQGAGRIEQPIRIRVPSSGVRFSFEMLYANQTLGAVAIAIPYSSEGSADLGLFLALAGTVLFWLGLLRRRKQARPRAGLRVVVSVLGVLVVGVGIAVFKAGLSGPALVSGVVLLGIIAMASRGRLGRLRRERAAQKAATRPPSPPARADQPTPPEPPSDDA